MTPLPRRRLRAGLLSAAVVLVPAAAGAAAVEVARRTAGEALALADPAGLLLALASLALAAVLAWAAAAAAAGVVDAWSAPARSPGAPSVRAVPGPAGRGRTGMVSAGVAALVVAALTAPGAAASTTGPAGGPVVVVERSEDATASTTPTGPAPTASAWAPAPTEDVPASAAPAVGTTAPAAQSLTPTAARSLAPTAAPVPAPVPASGPAPTAAPDLVGATDARPGSWAALADDGFRAPRGASAGSAALVTAQPTRQAPGGVGREVVVLAGDSLWSIAERHLGPGADATEVADAWPRWWEANRAVVGDDPHLLLPGQRLVAPAP